MRTITLLIAGGQEPSTALLWQQFRQHCRAMLAEKVNPSVPTTIRSASGLEAADESRAGGARGYLCFTVDFGLCQ
jgi:hypothetical protein